MEMIRLVSLIYLSCLFLNCKDATEPRESEVSPVIVHPATALEKALAVFDEPQIDQEEVYLRTLEIAQFLPDLNKDQTLQLYEKIISHRVLNKDAMLLTIQRLARLDGNAAEKLITNISGLKKIEITYLRALIKYTTNENNLPSLVDFFSVDGDELGRIYGSSSSFDGDGLKWHFWFEYYKLYPKRIDEDEFIDKPYILAKIRRGDTKDLEASSSMLDENDSSNLTVIEELILDYGVFTDRSLVAEWYKLKNFKAPKIHNESINRFKNIPESSYPAYDSLSEIEADLLCFSDFNRDSIFLSLDKVAHLKPQDYKRILSITTEWERDLMQTELSEACCYLYSIHDAIAAYKAVYDSTYSEDTHMTALPLLELVKTQPELAAQEYAKLSRWPMITPVGLYPILAENMSFTFCYHLAMYSPETALKLGGKYLDYPRMRGMVGSTDPLIGLAYGMCKAGEEQQLLNIIKNAPEQWTERERDFTRKVEAILQGIAMYSVEKWQHSMSTIDTKYHPYLIDYSLDYADPEASLIYLRSLPVNKDYFIRIQEFLRFRYQENPILALRLASKYKIAIKSLEEKEEDEDREDWH